MKSDAFGSAQATPGGGAEEIAENLESALGSFREVLRQLKGRSSICILPHAYSNNMKLFCIGIYYLSGQVLLLIARQHSREPGLWGTLLVGCKLFFAFAGCSSSANLDRPIATGEGTQQQEEVAERWTNYQKIQWQLHWVLVRSTKRLK